MSSKFLKIYHGDGEGGLLCIREVNHLYLVLSLAKSDSSVDLLCYLKSHFYSLKKKRGLKKTRKQSIREVIPLTQTKKILRSQNIIKSKIKDQRSKSVMRFAPLSSLIYLPLSHTLQYYLL